MNVSEMQGKLARWSTEDSTKRFFDLMKLVAQEDWLLEAFYNVKRNKGSKTAGVDGLNIYRFEIDLDKQICKLSESLLDGSFKPSPARRVYIPKKDGKRRPLGIPTVKDRIVQMAIKMALEPIWESDFLNSSHGFRPKRSTMFAIRHISWACTNKGKGYESYRWCIEGDFQSYFDTVHHKVLMRELRKRIKDSKLLDLIWMFLKSGIMEENLFKKSTEGVPQGGVLSPLLSNIYLHPLDKWMYDNYTEKNAGGIRRYHKNKGRANNYPVSYVRYADDFVVLVKGTKEEALHMRNTLSKFIDTELKLTLNMDKTQVTHINDGIEFLGYRIIRKRQASGKMKVVLQIPREAVNRICEKINIRESGHEDSTSTKIFAINKQVTGWCNYYKYATTVSSIFGKVETVAFWSLGHWLGQKYKSSISKLIRKYYKIYTVDGISRKTWIVNDYALKSASFIKQKKFMTKTPTQNPYLVRHDTSPVMNEDYVDTLTSIGNVWTGSEVPDRLGTHDLKWEVMKRDGYDCARCKVNENDDEYLSFNFELHHKKQLKSCSGLSEYNSLDNLELVCRTCHKILTKEQRKLVR